MPERSKWLDDLKALVEALENGTELPGEDDEAVTPVPRLRLIEGGLDDA
jgi:hypothetical protein